jgi:hypothetical protein
VTQTVDHRTEAGQRDALAEALSDPQVRDSLAVLAANASTLALLVSSTQALLLRSRDIMDNVNDRVEVLREASNEREIDYTQYRDLLLAFHDASPTVQSFLQSPILQPEIVDVISRVGQAALEADQATRGRTATVGGAFALMRQLKDPQVQETLAFFVTFAKAFGRDQQTNSDRSA